MEGRADLADSIRYPEYRWFILFLGWALFGLMGFNHTIIAARSEDLIVTLGITTQQYYLIYTGSLLAPIVLCLIGGMFGDRYGIRWVVGIGSVVGAVAFLLRLTADSFTPFFIYMILAGVGFGVVGPNLPKMVAEWFPPSQVPLATGLYLSASGLGMFLGLALGALWETWQGAVLTGGVFLAVVVIAWLIFVRDRQRGFTTDGRQITGVPFKEGFGRAIKSPNIWWAGFSYLIVAGMSTTWIGGIPALMLQTKEGFSSFEAAMVPALAVGGFIIGTIFWPILAQRVGVTKPFYMVLMVMAGIASLGVYLTAPSVIMWVLAPFPGFFVGGGPAFVMMLPIRLPEFGSRYAANAAGVLTSINHIGSFVMLPYMFEPIWRIGGPAWAMAFLLIVLVAGSLLYWPIPETGRRAMEKREKERQEAEAKAPSY